MSLFMDEKGPQWTYRLYYLLAPRAEDIDYLITVGTSTKDVGLSIVTEKDNQHVTN